MNAVLKSNATRRIAIDSLLEKNFKHREFKDILLSTTGALDRKHRELRQVKRVLMAILKRYGGLVLVEKKDFEGVKPEDTFEVNDDDERWIKITAK
jgi:hypothetical protein